MSASGELVALVFDWGDTLMRDFRQFPGPMAHWTEVEVLPGVTEALERLDERLIRCVASNAGSSDAELMKQALGRVDLDGSFQHFFTSRELGFSKPDARFFRAIARRLKVEPGECLMIGNDYDKDIVPAKSIGMHTVLLSDTLSRVGHPSADRVITSMASLPDEVRRLVSHPGSAS